MACNGHNHRPDCHCDFRGGHPSSVPPESSPARLFGALAPPRWLRASGRRSMPCPLCGMPTFYVPGRNGGSYVAGGDGLLLKHRCPKAVPKAPLRYRRSRSQRGWLAAMVVPARRRLRGNQVLRIVSLVEGAPFQVEVLDGLILDPSVPVMYRWVGGDRQLLELSYLAADGELSGTIVQARPIRIAS